MRTVTPPPQIEKQLKKEALYGCIICGCPVLEFVYLSNQGSDVYLPENMAALCPNDRNKHDNNDLQESQLQAAKNNPYNKNHEQEAFAVLSPDITVNVGKCKFVNTPRILVVDDFDIISINRSPDNSKYVLLDVNFFDRINNLSAVLSENSWHSERKNLEWTILYEPRHLLIENASNSLIFDARIDNNTEEITLLVDGFHYNGSLIKITEKEILVNDEEIALGIKGTSMKNYEAGIIVQTI
jgi:hypothetical protein